MIESLQSQTESIGSSELQAFVEKALRLDRQQQECRVIRVERRRSAYSSSYPIEDLQVYLDDGTSMELVFKNLSPGSLLSEAREVKPEFLHNPLREINTYLGLLDPDELGTARCHGVIVDDPPGCYGLLLEKVKGKELFQVGEFTRWQQVARWLAKLHDRFRAETERLTDAAVLLHYDRDFYRFWLQRAQTFISARLSREGSAADRAFKRLGAAYDAVIDRPLALPPTLIHGEFYASNVILTEIRGQLRICPIDWEMAALTAGDWTHQEKQALALTYRAALEAPGEWAPTEEDFLSALDCCRLALAVQWLGWAPDRNGILRPSTGTTGSQSWSSWLRG